MKEKRMNKEELRIALRALHSRIERMLSQADKMIYKMNRYDEDTDEYLDAKAEYESFFKGLQEEMKLHNKLLAELKGDQNG
jgi:uncharacterized coiled-coil DUF342 family protein